MSTTNKNQKNSQLKNFLKHYFGGLLLLISLVATTAIITLNLTFTYPLISRWLNLDLMTGVDHATLFYNYRRIIHYTNWPWITTLYMPDFPMSTTGEFHFWEVKVIFQVLQVIALLFVAWLIYAKRKQKQLRAYFNACANLTFFIFGSFLVIMLIDFDFFFYWFHRTFFNNDYWIFHPAYDPIILALPWELFMIKGFIIIGLLFLVATVIKIRFYLKKRRKV